MDTLQLTWFSFGNGWHVPLREALDGACSRKFYHIYYSYEVSGMFPYVGLVHENLTTLFTCGEIAGMFPYVGRYLVLAHENITTLFTSEDVAGMFLFAGL